MRSTVSLPFTQVVAAVLRDREGRVLIAQRPAGKPLAGYWEFPGGKLEADEQPVAALSRELREELGIEVQAAYRLLRFDHDYPDKRVELDVWRVTAYRAVPAAHEGQQLAWVRPDELPRWQLLPADQPIVTALRLPLLMQVTPMPGDRAGFLASLRVGLDAGIDLVQFRAPGLDTQGFEVLGKEVMALCRAAGTRVVVNADPVVGRRLGADGIHLSQVELQRQDPKQGRAGLLGISCHNPAEIATALVHKPDYIVLGPVRPTASHAEAVPLGWERFRELAALSPVPVYAIGALSLDDLQIARRYGAHGIAAIRALWGVAQLSSFS